MAVRARHSSMRPMVAALLLTILAGCGMGILPGDPILPEGHREWIVPVENRSNAPARLMVAEDEGVAGDLVGSADPPQVAANATEDVVLTVPPGRNWAVFVNPGPTRGPLLLSVDVPEDFEGRLPITIHIDDNGEPSFSHSGDLPGWFGQ